MSDAARRTLRTIVQTLLGLAAALPLIISSAGIPRTAIGVGTALAVAAGATRVMQLDAVQRLIPRWLRSAVPDSSDTAGSPAGKAAEDKQPANGGAV
ncbi:hypothetical protein ACIQNI_08750 [Streptomyces sp. NPDC091266]|uniref:hypothetical protein n=1 Tax=Streptomyces sp. NPDC091266 TaxID=3365978 RepID=UPI0038084C46